MLNLRKCCLFCILIVLFIVLACNNSSTNNHKNEPISDSKSIKSSDIIENINVRTLEGREDIIDLKDNVKGSVQNPAFTIIFVFSPSCPTSIQNISSINKLLTDKGKDYRFIGVSLIKLNPKIFIDSNAPKFPVYMNGSGNARKLGLGLVPQTIVISPEGRILKKWVGAYSGSVKTEIEEFFNVSLPGSDESGSCTLCVNDLMGGAPSSPGAISKTDKGFIRCKQDGQWAEVDPQQTLSK